MLGDMLTARLGFVLVDSNGAEVADLGGARAIGWSTASAGAAVSMANVGSLVGSAAG